MDDGSGHQLHPGPYAYDPNTNTFVTLSLFGYGWGVDYSWIPPENQQRSSVPLGRPPVAAAQRGRRGRGGRPPMAGAQRGGRGGRPPMAAAQRGGRGGRPAMAAAQRGGRGGRPAMTAAQRGGRGGRHGLSPPRQHGGPGLLGSDPSNQQLPPPSPRRRAPDEEPSSSQQPPAQVMQPAVPVHLPPENKDPTSPPPPAGSRSPSSHVMTPPVSDPAKNSNVADVSMTAAAKGDDAQDDMLVAGLGGSGSTSATDKKRLLRPIDPPAPMKTVSDVDVSMARRDDDDQGDVLGLNVYMARKRLLSAKASNLAADADADAEEEAKAAATKKTRLGWGQGLAKYENRVNKDDETTHKLVAHDGAATEPAASHGSSPPPPGSKGHGDNNSLDMAAETRVSQVTTAPALFSKGSSRPLTEENSDLSSSLMTAIAASDLGSSQGCDASSDESSNKLKMDQDIPQNVISECSDNIQNNPRTEKVIVKMLQKPRKILKRNVLSEEPETNELQGSKLKEWSQEEKDVISEEITTFGMNFSNVSSSFLGHKTAADCMEYYSELYKSECHKEAQRCLPTTVIQSQENYYNENDAAPLLSGIATVTAAKNYLRMNTKAEDVKKPVNQICHESTANLLAHSLPDKGHSESSMDESKRVTGKNLVGESNAAPSPHGKRSSQAVCLTIPRTEAPVLENFNEDSCPNEAVCITKSSSKAKENVPQSVLIANHGDEGNCVAGGSCAHDTMKTMSLPGESCAKLANGTIKGDQIRSGAKTPELRSLLKACNDTAWKATEKKLANSNIVGDRKAPSDMKYPNSKDNPCLLTGPAFVEHMMKSDQAMERDSGKNDDKVRGKEGDNPVLCVSSIECGGTQLTCEVNSQTEIDKVDSIIPSPEGNCLDADMENPTKESSPCVATNSAVVRDDLIQRLRASEAMYRNSGGNEGTVKSMEGNPVYSVASKVGNGIELSCNVASQKGKGVIPSPEVNDLNAAPMQISNGAPKTYHLPSRSGSAALDIVHANSSYVAMDIDLNIPLDVTPLDVTSVDVVNSHAKAYMGPNDETDSDATDSDATMEISPSQTTTVRQTAQQLPADEPAGSIRLFGRVVYQAQSTGTTNHTPNQGNQTVVYPSIMASNPVVPVTRIRGGQAYPSGATTTTSVWRSSVPNNQLVHQAVPFSIRMPYSGSTNGASAAAAALPLQPGSSALANLMNQQRQQALSNMSPYTIMRGGVPVLSHSHLMPGSSGGAAFVNFNGFNSVQQQWPAPILDTSRLVVGYPLYYPGATANQAPATATAMPSTGTNNGEGGSTSRAPPGGEIGRGRGSWLSLPRN